MAVASLLGNIGFSKPVRSRLLGTVSLLAVGVVAATGAALAQDNGETVVVTGSRISTPGFEAPTPVSSISQDYIQTNSVLQGLQVEYTIPQLVPGQVAQTQQAAGGSVGGSFFNARGLGNTRTLTLLDGRRLMQSDYNGAFDATLLPASLIKRVDIVTGGASAAYGSDAVAGVVNIILDNQYEGLKGSMSYGQTQYHDMNTADFFATWGMGFDGGKGHIVMSGELYSNQGCNFCVGTRPWARKGWITVANPLYKQGTANGQPNFVNFQNETFSALSSGGIITGGPLKGTMFLGGGVTTPIVYGNYVGSMFMQGGTGDPFWQYGTISPSIGRQSFYSHISYDLTPDLTVWGQLLISHVNSWGGSVPNYSAGDITITNQNPFLPASIVTQMAAAKITTFTLGRTNIDIPSNDLRYGPPGTPLGDFNIEVNHNYYVAWAAGLNGKITSDISWDLSAQFFSNSYWALAPDNRVQNYWQAAIDTVANPATASAGITPVAGVPAGAPVCRVSTLAPGTYIIPGQTTVASPQPAAGCVPINIFGTGNVTPSQALYFLQTSYNWFPMQSWDIAGNVTGVAFKNWAGDVSFAAGFEVVRKSIHGYTDPLSTLKAYRFNNIQAYTGQLQSEEGYLEVNIPLLKDLPLVQGLSMDDAFRYVNYSQSGDTTTWKLSLNWTITNEIRARFTNSHDFRAPNMNELFSPVAQNFSQVTDLSFNPPQLYSSAQGTGGNPNLQPEVGLTNTGGIVYTPDWLSGFNMSLDYWQLHMHSAIVSSGAQGVINNCYLYGQSNFCSGITRSPTTGLIVLVQAVAYNVATIETAGVDGEVGYSFPADMLWDGLNGNFAMRLVAAYTDRYITSQPGSVINSVNQKWRGNWSLTWSGQDLKIGLTARYVGMGKINTLYTECGTTCVGGVANTINNNTVNDRMYFGANVEYALPGWDHFKLFGSVNNLLNTAPPNAANGIFIPQTSPGQLYDNQGRLYTVGLRFAY